MRLDFFDLVFWANAFCSAYCAVGSWRMGASGNATCTRWLFSSRSRQPCRKHSRRPHREVDFRLKQNPELKVTQSQRTHPSSTPQFGRSVWQASLRPQRWLTIIRVAAKLVKQKFPVRNPCLAGFWACASATRRSGETLTFKRNQCGSIQSFSAGQSVWYAKIPSGSHLTEMSAFIC